MTEHSVFKFFSGITLLTAFFFTGMYDVITLTSGTFREKLILKCIPVIIFMMLPICYILMYGVSLYSSLTFLGLFFCFLGDIFMSFYNSNSGNLTAIFIISGVFFTFARFLFLVTLMIKPGFVLIKYPLKNIILSHLLFNTPFIILGFLNIIYNTNQIISVLIFLYLLVGFGFQLSYAFLRIDVFKDIKMLTKWEMVTEEKEETKSSSILAFLGILLFDISDVLLLITMFTNFLPLYCIVISDNIYWIAMFCLAVSIVRYPTESLENNRE